MKTIDGVKVGNITTYTELDNKTMNIVWLGINKKNEGNGYGQSAMRTIIDDAKKQGVNRLTLEVPTNSPNARHIYEKYGFKAKSDITLGDGDDVWGGLTEMELKL